MDNLHTNYVYRLVLAPGNVGGFLSMAFCGTVCCVMCHCGLWGILRVYIVEGLWVVCLVNSCLA